MSTLLGFRAAAAGLWWAAGAVVALVVLVGLRPVGPRLIAPLTHQLRTLDIRYEKGHGTLGPVLDAIREAGGDLEDIDIEDTDDGSTRTVVVGIRIADPEDLDEVERRLSRLPEVSGCDIRGNGRISPVGLR